MILSFVEASKIYKSRGMSIYFCAVLYFSTRFTYEGASIFDRRVVVSWWSEFVFSILFLGIILYIPGRILDAAIRAEKDKQRRKNKQKNLHSDRNHSNNSIPSINDKNNLSVTESEQTVPDSSKIERTSVSVTDHQMFQEVVSTLTKLGGTATTSQIAESMDISRVGAYDRLRTLETEGDVTSIDDNTNHTWELVE